MIRHNAEKIIILLWYRIIKLGNCLQSLLILKLHGARYADDFTCKLKMFLL